MADKALRRKSMLGVALIVTIAACIYPTEEQPVLHPRKERSHVPQLLSAALNSPASQEPEWIAADTDPFAARTWGAPPPSAQEKVLAPVAPLPPSVPEPQPLPFKFVGQMVDGSDRMVYLHLNEQVIVARNGDMLEGGYKVVEVTPTQIGFESLADGRRQSLSIPAQEN